MSSKKKTTTISLSLPSGSSLAAPAARVPAQGGKKKKGKKSDPFGKVSRAYVSSSTNMTSSQPKIVSGDGRIRVAHREFLCDVTAHQYYRCENRPINPGLITSFRWLSNLARMYESYRFVSLRFDYVTSVGTSKDGAFMMAVDYDAFDFHPPTKEQFLMQHGAQRSSIWSNLCLPCDTADLHKFGTQRYTRAGTLDSNLDIKTYDVGQLQWATSACSDEGQVCGEIYVSYVVDLFTPQPPYWPDWGAEKIYSQECTPPIVLGPDAVKLGELGVTASTFGGASRLNFTRSGTYLLAAESLGTLIGGQTPYFNFLSGLSSVGATLSNIGKWQQEPPAKNLTMAKITVPTDNSFVSFNLDGKYSALSNLLLIMTPYADI